MNALYKNPLFKNLSPYPQGDSQNSGCFNLTTLAAFGIRFFFLLGGSGFVVAWLVMQTPEIRTLPAAARWLTLFRVSPGAAAGRGGVGLGQGRAKAKTT